MNPLYELKQQLFEALGDEKEKQYLQCLRKWILGRMTREEFDREASALVMGSHLSIHNRFILEILHGAFSVSKHAVHKPIVDKAPPPKRRRGGWKADAHKCNNVDAHDQAEFVFPTLPHHFKDLSYQSLRFASHELFLPDVEMINGRFHVTAWTNKLTGVESQIAEIIIQAVQIYLKNIITAVLTRYRGYKLKKGAFQYNVGGDVPNPWLRNTTNIDVTTNDSNIPVALYGSFMIPTFKPTLPEVELKSLYSYACSNNTNRFGRHVKMQHLYHALKNNPEVISNHCVYSAHMERIILALRNT